MLAKTFNINKLKASDDNPRLINRIVFGTALIVVFFVFTGLCQAANFDQSGTPSNDDTSLYVPNNYVAEPGESSKTVEVTVGDNYFATNSEYIRTFEAVVNFDPDEIVFDADPFDFSGTQFDGLSPAPVTTQTLVDDELSIGFVVEEAQAKQFAEDDIVFRLKFSVLSDVNPGTDIVLRFTNVTIGVQSGLVGPVVTSGVTTIASGKVTIPGAVQCSGVECGEHGTCNTITGQCECNQGYAGFDCGDCDENYVRNSGGDCIFDVLSALRATVLTFDQSTINSLSTAERESAYKTAYLMVNSINAEGKEVNVESTPFTIPAHDAGTYPDCSATPGDCINDIASQLGDDIEAGGIDVLVTKYPSAPGLLKLTAATGNADGTLDGIFTDSGAVTIFPGLDYTITLHPTASYHMMVVGKFEDGTAKELNFNQVTWMPQPVNRLDDNALNGGLLEKGDVGGKGPLFVQVEKSGGNIVNSNTIVVEVPLGPVIEYSRLIGTGAITRGDRIILNTKLSDIGQISDIADIRTSFVRSIYSTYEEISEDSDADWFTATPFVDEANETDSGEEEGKNFVIYNIPVEVPQSATMSDGDYKLLLQLTDEAGHVAGTVISIVIGESATGDVNGDGNLTMMDVILAFRMSSGSIAPTEAQRTAADINGDGNLTMMDVILLFRQINQ